MLIYEREKESKIVDLKSAVQALKHNSHEKVAIFGTDYGTFAMVAYDSKSELFSFLGNGKFIVFGSDDLGIHLHRENLIFEQFVDIDDLEISF